MKLTLFSTHMLITFVTLLFLPTSFAQGAPPENMVQLIYFLPSDRAPQRDMDTKLDTLIKGVQQFYADELERHEFGRKTFRFETDTQGSTVIHRIDGQFSSTYYYHNTFSKVVEEIQERFPIERHAHLIIIEIGSANYEGGNSCGTSTTHYEGTGGYALMPAFGHCVTGDSALSLAAHELGHVFGLPHDFRDNAYIMSYGHFRRELSQCAAEWLDVHPYFNTPQNAFKHPTVIQMLPLQEVPPDTLRFRFQVTDVNGLHQVQLLASTSSIPAAVGSLELIECQSLTGKSSTVEFVTTELTGRPATEVSLQVMDVSGNFRLQTFPIQRPFLPGPKIEGPWLWMITPTAGQGGANAAASGIDFLAQASGGTVTEQHIATHGASLGDAVGNKVWIPGSIAPTGLNNITETVNTIGLGIGDTDNHVAYGSLSLIAPRKQNTMMFVGSDDAVKVWLNGVLVHNNPIDRPAVNYQDHFPVTLKKGKNILLVAVYENWGDWSGFFGFKNDTEYTVLNIKGTPVTRPKIAGPKIEGPWLWVITPTGWDGGANAAASGIDFLAQASGGTVTETQVATNGAIGGDAVGNHQWTPAKISPVGADNINDLVNASGLGTGDIDNHVAYGCVVLRSPRPQETTMYVGSDDAIKVWLNGVLVHNNPVNRGASDYQELFPVTLKQGTNILLVAVYELWGGWSGFFGFENEAVYTVSIIVEDEPKVPTWDVNRDGQINILDMVLIAQHLGSASTNSQFDVNGDGTVNILDIVIVAQHLGESTDAAAPSFLVTDNRLNPAMIQAWIARAQAENDGSLVFQQGIANLQRLLTLLMPKKTVLLANYPNPFNPETWIPYQLANACDVEITIYDMQGVIVRRLALGHQSPGHYTSKERAAYWDGRNTLGERAASGIYFYQLQTDSLSPLRKMVILK